MNPSSDSVSDQPKSSDKDMIPDSDTSLPPGPTIPHLNRVERTTFRQLSNDDLRKQLFEAAMSSQWNLVFELYCDNKPMRNTTITRANETVLHVVVSGAPEYNVLRFLDVLVQETSSAELKNILGSKNKDGNTPLHLAAALGLENVCRKMAIMCPVLAITARNKLQETALLTAVQNGKKRAFFVLEAAIQNLQNLMTDSESLSTRDIAHCRGYDANTILHYAIKEEQFDLAYEIIHLYPLLVHCVNSSGETALHVLANKPYVFKSGTHYGPYDNNIFYCSITKPLVLKFNDFKEKEKELYNSPLEILKDENELPATYNTGSSLRNGICKACCTDVENPPEEQGDTNEATEEMKNYGFAIFFFRLIIKLPWVIGSRRVRAIEKKKEKHMHACQIMNKLLERLENWTYEDESAVKQSSRPPVRLKSEGKLIASPLLVAARMGTLEMVVKILQQYPVALWDHDEDDKNIVLLAVEHRQVHIYEHMLKFGRIMANIFTKLDKQCNSALHLAAMLGQSNPWSITSTAFQMQWEIKWYKYVLNSMDKDMIGRINNAGKRAQDVFTENHETLVKEGSTWLTDTSQSCSVVALTVATVAFASASTVPGGVNQVSGLPVLAKRQAFPIFAIESLFALSCSVTSLLMFLAIFISRHKEMDFERRLPVMLILGLTTLFLSIASMLVSFCAGNLFIMSHKLKFAAYLIYVVMCVLVIVFATVQFKVFVHRIKAIIKKFPERTVSSS